MFRPLKQALRSAEATKNPVFVSRALNAIMGLETALSSQRIDEATAEATDYRMLIKALALSPVAVEVAKDDPLVAARLRGAQRKKELVERGRGLLTSEDVAQHLNITRQAVAKRRANNRLLSLEQGRRGYVYPSFQFADGGMLAGFGDVLAQLEGVDPWMQLAFFVGANDRLGGRPPEEVLRRGQVDRVVQAAASYGEQGAA